MSRLLASTIILLLTVTTFTNNADAALTVSDKGVRLQVTNLGAAGLTIKYDLSSVNNSGFDGNLSPVTLTETEDGCQVPVISRFIAIPPGHRADVRVVQRQSCYYDRSGIRLINDGKPISNVQPATMNLDPPEAAIVSNVKIMRGIPVATISLFPVQFEKSNGSVSDNGAVENRSLEVEIVFEPDANVPVVRPVNDPPGSDMALMLDNILLNPPQRDLVGNQMPYRGRILILHQDDDVFEENGRPWIDSLAIWKRQMGYLVEIEAVEVVDDQGGGVTPVEIRTNIIRPRYFDEDEIPLSYLIIIGADAINPHIWFPSYVRGYVSDHFYSLMYNVDAMVSDIAIGRIYVQNIADLRGVIIRTVSYERDPYVEDGDDWFVHALVNAEEVLESQYVPSMKQLGIWIQMRLFQNGYELVDTLWADDDNPTHDQEVREAIEEGRGLLLSRGWLAGALDEEEDEPTRTGRRHPFVMAVTCLSAPIQNQFFQYARWNPPNGPIASIVLTEMSYTKEDNSLLGGAIRGMTHFDLHNVGLIYNFAKYQMDSDNYGPIEDRQRENIAGFRLLGDPSTQFYNARPFEMNVEYPEFITTGATGLSISVSAEDEDVFDAWVTVWQPDGIHLVCQPGENGWARFTFEEGDIEEGDLGITVTRYNALPYLGAIEVGEAEAMVDLEEIDFDNDDGVFANGENVLTTLTFRNSGDVNLNNLVVTLSTDASLITFSEDELEIGNLARGAAREQEFELRFDRACHKGDTVRVQIDVTNGQITWEHSFIIIASGHLLSETGEAVVDNEFEPGRNARFAPRLLNSGDLATPAMNAVLVSLDNSYVRVVEGEARYPAIAAEDGADLQGFFRVEADSLAIAGNMAKFQLILTAHDQNDAFRDTVEFEEMIGDPQVSDPYGPDEYGYLVFDSGDEGWEKCPEYDWIEINPDQDEPDFIGEEVELGDNDVDEDETRLVELPFTFRFYGELFDTIAVNSNGWIAFGADKGIYVDFRNELIPGIMGPDAQVAVFWQDLINPLPDGRGVFMYYDEEEGLFIIEWSDMKIYADGNNNANEAFVAFQVILFDPGLYPTSSGDGEIKLQYETVRNEEGDRTDNKYFTVGIKNLDGTDGIQYAYWDVYSSPSNRPLENGLALLFTTDRVTEFGGLSGRITYREDPGRGIPDVEVASLRTGIGVVTNMSGLFEIDSIPVGEDRILISKEGFNSIVIAVMIREGQEVRIDTSMTHPELIVSNEHIRKELKPGPYGTTFNINIENEGNGPLDYHIVRRYQDGSGTEYESRWSRELSSVVDDGNLYGCQFIGDKVYVSGGGLRGPMRDEMIYVFNSDGDTVRSFHQPSTTERGLKDLAWDGRLLYGGERRGPHNEEVSVIVAFDTLGNEQHTIVLPFDGDELQLPWALAWNPNNSTLIVGYQDYDIFVINRDGEEIDRFSIDIPGVNLQIRGLAWNQFDDDGMQLYIVDQPGQRGMRLFKADIETGEARVAGQIQIANNDLPKSLTIGYQWEQGRASMASILHVGNRDSLRIYEMGPDTHFMTINPDRGLVLGGESLNIECEMRAESLTDTGIYPFSLLLNHNALGEAVIIPITLHVHERSGIDNSGEGVPLEFNLGQAYPNPFNNTTRIDFTLPEAVYTRLAVYDLAGRRIAELVGEKLEPGHHTAIFAPEAIASGIYFYKLKAGERSAVKRMVYLR